MEFQNTRNKNNISKGKKRELQSLRNEKESVSLPAILGTEDGKTMPSKFYFYNIDFYTQPNYLPIKLAIKYKSRIRASKFSKIKNCGSKICCIKPME